VSEKTTQGRLPYGLSADVLFAADNARRRLHRRVSDLQQSLSYDDQVLGLAVGKPQTLVLENRYRPGCSDAMYAVRSTMSRSVRLATTGFIASALRPSRAPLLKS
jgi:hypothetical protein